MQGFVCPTGSLISTPEPPIITRMDPLTLASFRLTAAIGVMMAASPHRTLATSSAVVSDELPHLKL